MKALTYQGPGRRRWHSVPDPVIKEAGDAIVRIDCVTICGTDLHILKGDVADVEAGRILGHEAVGTVEEVGSAVTTRSVGDRVIISCISSCGRCDYCRHGRYGQCRGNGGWILGHLIDGTQAERVRVPFADTSTHLLPGGVAMEEAVMLADILPTAYEVGVINGRIRPGDTVAVIGAGPIGLAAVTTARLFSPSQIIVVDPAQARRDAAAAMGADVLIDPITADVAQRVAELTGGLGVHVAIEAVGVPETFERCVEIVRPGGHVANVGVHGRPATLHLETAWIRDLTITTGLVDTSTTPELLQMLASDRLSMPGLVTHRFGLDEFDDAYDVFSHPADTKALKVVLFGAEAMEELSV